MIPRADLMLMALFLAGSAWKSFWPARMAGRRGAGDRVGGPRREGSGDEHRRQRTASGSMRRCSRANSPCCSRSPTMPTRTALCFPSIPVLARKARLKERQTQNCIRNLVSEGFVHVQTGAGPKGCNRYVVDTAAIEARSITGAVGGPGRPG